MLLPTTNGFIQVRYVSSPAKLNSHKDSGREGNRINKNLHTKMHKGGSGGRESAFFLCFFFFLIMILAVAQYYFPSKFSDKKS